MGEISQNGLSGILIFLIVQDCKGQLQFKELVNVIQIPVEDPADLVHAVAKCVFVDKQGFCSGIGIAVVAQIGLERAKQASFLHLIRFDQGAESVFHVFGHKMRIVDLCDHGIDAQILIEKNVLVPVNIAEDAQGIFCFYITFFQVFDLLICTSDADAYSGLAAGRDLSCYILQNGYQKVTAEKVCREHQNTFIDLSQHEWMMKTEQHQFIGDQLLHRLSHGAGLVVFRVVQAHYNCHMPLGQVDIQMVGLLPDVGGVDL